MTAPKIRITVDGKLAWTLEQAAEAMGVEPSTMRGEITRYKIESVAPLDGKKKLYLASVIKKWWPTRPGTGRARKDKAAKSPE